MNNELSDTAKSIIVLLNNIEELIVISNDRKQAVDVMKALCIYAKEKGFKIPEEKTNNFFAVILDSRPTTMQYIIRDIAKIVAEIDTKK